MYGGFLQEPKLLALAYDLEQEINTRSQPTFAGDVQTYPDAGICDTLGEPQRAARMTTPKLTHHLGTGKTIRH